MTQILIILALIILNGVFSMSELALVSAKRNRLETQAGNGSRGARAALQLADEPSRFLSAVQVGITLISIFNGAFGEASLVARLTPTLAAIPAVAPYARDIALGIVVFCITFVSIVLGELVPKRIAMQYPEAMATWIAPPLRTLSTILAPFVKVLSFTTDSVVRLLGMHKPKDDTPTEEDVAVLIKESTDAGVFAKTESDIAARALRLDDRHLRALMTPRVDIDYLNIDETLQGNLERIARSPYNRFPVYRDDRSNVLGIVHSGVLFAQAVQSGALERIDIGAALKPPLFVPETVSAMNLLELLKQHRTETALIVDEYGEVQGMATKSDVMDALVGDVGILGEEHAPDAIQREDGSWLMDGVIALDRFREVTGAALSFPGESAAYHTLAGFVLFQLGHIPKAAEVFEWNAHRFEVVDMDGNRIDRVLVSKLPEPAEAPHGASPVPGQPQPL